jgi:hypothetical protein
MSFTELIGWAATLLAFSVRDVRLLRLASVGASLAFITYGAAANAWPVLALHCLLLPVNLLRLRELRRKPGDSLVRNTVGPESLACRCRQSAANAASTRASALSSSLVPITRSENKGTCPLDEWGRRKSPPGRGRVAGAPFDRTAAGTSIG